MNATASLIECEKGVQAELSLPRNWTLYSNVYSDAAAAHRAATAIAKTLGITLTWEPETEGE